MIGGDSIKRIIRGCKFVAELKGYI